MQQLRLSPTACFDGQSKGDPMRFLLHHLLAAGVVGACVDDEDCELLGRCVSGACQCAPGFVGPTCGALDLLPVKDK